MLLLIFACWKSRPVSLSKTKEISKSIVQRIYPIDGCFWFRYFGFRCIWWHIIFWSYAKVTLNGRSAHGASIKFCCKKNAINYDKFATKSSNWLTSDKLISKKDLMMINEKKSTTCQPKYVQTVNNKKFLIGQSPSVRVLMY